MIELILYIAFPVLFGIGAALFLDHRRGENPVDFGPWKLMAGLIIAGIVSTIVMGVWSGISVRDFANWDEPRTLDNLIADILIYPAMAFPGAYLAAAITSAAKGVKHPRAFLIAFTILTPIIGACWFFVLISYGCITTGSCL